MSKEYYRGSLTVDSNKFIYEVYTKRLNIKQLNNTVEMLESIYVNGACVYNIKEDNFENYLMLFKSKYYKELFKEKGFGFANNFFHSFNVLKAKGRFKLNLSLRTSLNGEIRLKDGMLCVDCGFNVFEPLKSSIAFYIKPQAELCLLDCIYEDIYNEYGVNLTGYKDNRYLLQKK